MNNREGLTLIEIVITIAIISIMVVTIMGIFNSSVTNIFKSGYRTEEVLKVKADIDYKIKTNENKTDGTDSVKITILGDNIHEINIKGISIENEPNDFNIQIKAFVPNIKKLDSN